MPNLLEHAKAEIAIHLSKCMEDGGMEKALCDNVLELIEAFSKQGHSGLSANYAITMFSKLASYKILSPLTGEPDEWTKVTDSMYQNKRCYSVFKDAEGNAWDIDGIVFIDKQGGHFTNGESRVKVTFPYTPTTVYVNANE